MRYTQRSAAASTCCSRTTLADGRATSWNSCSSERQKPWQVRAERLLATASEDVGAATAELYPKLSLGGFIGLFALRGSSLFDAGARLRDRPHHQPPGVPAGQRQGSQAVAQGALAGHEQAMLLAQEDVENAVTQLAENQTRLVSLLQSARHGSTALQSEPHPTPVQLGCTRHWDGD